MAPRPRWVLHLQATFWRTLMGIGMFLHRLASPHPPKANFKRRVKSTVSTQSGTFDINFYVPRDYETQRRLGFKKVKNGRGYPVVINFHGGGFTLGSPSDDGRWIGTVVDECQAVVVSVDYRRAPEHPFPTAVDDGVDAVLYIAENAKELGVDKDKIALSGFSSGGNMAFTVPLRMYDYLTDFARPMSRGPSRAHLSRTVSSRDNLLGSMQSLQTQSAASSSTAIGPGPSRLEAAGQYNLSVPYSPTSPVSPIASGKDAAAVNAIRETTPTVTLCAIVPWYPSLDYTRTRAQRRSTNVRKDQELPAIFTDLFDESYLHPPDTIPLDSPYLSPGIASDAHLRNALPRDIIMHTCEWDMLLAEGQDFYKRLVSREVGEKNVVYKMIEGVPHGWDKAPNPVKPTPGVKAHYLKACKELRRVFGDESSQGEILDRRRKSVPVVR